MIGGVKVGISICEDVWSPIGPVAEQAAGGAELSININGSPFHAGKSAERERMLATRASDSHTAIVYVNQVGGQDELVFDGASVVFDHEGTLVARAAQFDEALLIVDVPVQPVYRKRLLDPRGRLTESCCRPSTCPTRRAHMRPTVGVMRRPPEPDARAVRRTRARDSRLLRKNGFDDVVIGLSGGIDSTIVACVAVDALGRRPRARRLDAVALLSDHSKSDAADLAEQSRASTSGRSRSSRRSRRTSTCRRRRSPARARRPDRREHPEPRSAVLLMALSNEFGWMVLTTGNKSEVAVGYFTIYGDSVGGYGVIKDVLKTRVYDLCRYVNRTAGREIIPESVITKPPSAELRPDQRDDQSLPPYEVLDPILELYVEDDRTAAEIIELGHDEAMVRRITRLVDVTEYKRRQCPPGVRVSRKAFGKDRRLPITNGYRG